MSLTVLLVQVLGDEVVKDTLTAAPGDIGEGTHDQRGDDDENHDDEHGNESSSSHCSCLFYVRGYFCSVEQKLIHIYHTWTKKSTLATL